MPNLVIRPATEADLPAVQSCLRQTWHATYDQFFGAVEVTEISGRWHAIDVLCAQLERPDARFLVAVRDGRIVGTASAEVAAPGHLTLARLYVLPDAQGIGIGRALLRAVIAAFQDVERVRLEVEARNAPAIAFYTAQGFNTVGNIGPREGHGSGSVVILERELMPGMTAQSRL